MDQNVSENILFIGFNQDSECFTCGLESGYRIYNTEPLKETAREGGRSPKYSTNKAIIWDDFQKKVAISLDFNTEVLGIKLRRDRIAIVFEKMVKVYTFSQTPQLLHVFETYENKSGICCLCSHSSNSNLAHLGKKAGHVTVINLLNTEKSPIEIDAHEAPLSCMALSNDGHRLATASVKGTLVRVFDAETGARLHELRRGTTPCRIYCLNFNKMVSKLCVSSDRGTVHVFSLDAPEKNSRSSFANASFLPKYFQSKWSSFKFDIPNNSKCVCAFTQNLDQHSIVAICADGTYYKYSLDNVNNTKTCELELCTKFLELSSR